MSSALVLLLRAGAGAVGVALALLMLPQPPPCWRRAAAGLCEAHHVHPGPSRAATRQVRNAHGAGAEAHPVRAAARCCLLLLRALQQGPSLHNEVWARLGRWFTDEHANLQAAEHLLVERARKARLAADESKKVVAQLKRELERVRGEMRALSDPRSRYGRPQGGRARFVVPKDASPALHWHLKLMWATLTIQRTWRGFASRRRFLKVVEVIAFGESAEEDAAGGPFSSPSLQRRAELWAALTPRRPEAGSNGGTPPTRTARNGAGDDSGSARRGREGGSGTGGGLSGAGGDDNRPRSAPGARPTATATRGTGSPGSTPTRNGRVRGLSPTRSFSGRSKPAGLDPDTAWRSDKLHVATRTPHAASPARSESSGADNEGGDATPASGVSGSASASSLGIDADRPGFAGYDE